LNRLAGATVDECLGVFLRQAASPFLKSLPGEHSAFGVRILQRSPKVLATPVIEFIADGLRDELTAVLLSPIDVPYKVIRQGDGDTINAGHFILQV
jgi:hypothetical protein